MNNNPDPYYATDETQKEEKKGHWEREREWDIDRYVITSVWVSDDEDMW